MNCRILKSFLLILILDVSAAIDESTSEILKIPEILKLPKEFTKVEKIVSEARGREFLASITKSGVSSKITHGNTAGEFDFPFFALATIFRHDENNYVCGSTLITRQLTLLAANCFHGKQFYGSQFWFGADRDGFHIYRNGIAHVHHPNYGPLTNDIGFFILDSPVGTELNAKLVRPISLPSSTTTLWILNGKIVTAVGYGHDENGNSPRYLQYTTLKVISDQQCQNDVGIWPEATVICAKNTTGYSGVCVDDIGGPILFENKLFGVSAVLFHASKCINTVVGFTRIDRYLDWLEGYTKMFP